jgi:hypothetical protein
VRPRSQKHAQAGRNPCRIETRRTRWANSYEESQAHISLFKRRVENEGDQILSHPNKRIIDEKSLQFAFYLTWFEPERTVSREVRDGRGAADFKVSGMSGDCTIIEIKLARNLRRNFKRQVELYQIGSNARWALTAIVFFSPSEKKKVERILAELHLQENPDIILIDASRKPSASKIKA